MKTHGEEKQLDYEIRSEAVQEILGYVPHWMVNWGNTLVLVISLGLFLLSYFIEYPNTIKAKAVLTTANPSKKIHAPLNGDIHSILVSDRANVKKEELIGIVKNVDSLEKLKSSVEGQIYFVDFLREGNSILQGDYLFSIVPKDYGYYKARVKIPYSGVINVNKGQEVRLNLNNSELTKQNPIIGFVSEIASIPDSLGQIMIEVKLPDELITTHGEKIAFFPGIEGEATIITEDLRLIERFFYQLRNIF